MGWWTNFKAWRKTNFLVSTAKVGHLRQVERLLNEGMYVNAKNADGWTALIAASASDQPSKGRLAVVKLLKAHGAKE